MAKKKAARKRSRGSDGDGGDEHKDGEPASEVPSAPGTDEAESPEPGSPVDEAAEPTPAKAVAAPEPTPAKAVAAPGPEIKVAPPVNHRGAAWGEPFAKIARGFDWFETRLLAAVLFGLVFALVAWVSLVGLSAPLESDSAAGVVFRGILGAIVLGGLSRLLGKKLALSENAKAALTAVAIVAAIALAPTWRKVGVEYFGHIQNWLQEGSSLAMLGGLRGVGTRITILLALLGGSLAAAAGKHINIDVVMRFTPDRLKVPMFATSTLATVAVLLGASWGFFDYIAIESFNYRPSQLQEHHKGEAFVETTKSDEIAYVKKRVGQHLFLYRKQIGLDLGALGHVLGGSKWDDPTRLNGRQWNALLDDGFEEKFTKQEVDDIRSVPDQLGESRVPLVVVPGGGSARNLLIPTMNLMFPLGFLIIAVRFLLRLLLVMSGHEQLEDDAAAAADPKKGDAPPAAKAAESGQVA